MPALLNISDIFQNIARVIGVTWFSAILVARVYDFHVSYLHIIERTKKEAWLLQQCQDDKFFHSLQAHSGIQRCPHSKPNASHSFLCVRMGRSVRDRGRKRKDLARAVCTESKLVQRQALWFVPLPGAAAHGCTGRHAGCDLLRAAVASHAVISVASVQPGLRPVQDTALCGPLLSVFANRNF